MAGRIAILSLVATVVCVPAGAAETMIADKVLHYEPAPEAVYVQPYGWFERRQKVLRLSDFAPALDGNPNTSVSLPKGAIIVVGFSDGAVFDGPGDDLFVAEIGDSEEIADVYVSADSGLSFTPLGRAYGHRVTRFDLGAIGYRDFVNAVKVVGLDNKGLSPGFDLAYVEGLEGSVALGGDEDAPGVFSVGLGRPPGED